ncbi:MAG TPA: hypothetical protein VJI66_02310 [Candidatus Paceibacterota bacterium]
MTKKDFLSIVSALFLIIGIIHLIRIVSGWDVQVGDLMIPVWASWVGVIVAFYLSFQGFKLRKE